MGKFHDIAYLSLYKTFYMQEQNFKNHAQMVPGFHYVTFGLLFALLGGSINYLIKSTPENKYLASLVVLITVIFVLIAWYARVFALKAQDRAIKAEESLRYYIMTGKALPTELTISQIIALRFASDAEYLALLDRAIKENLSNKEIKLAIQNWKADYYRV
jgi:type IV secretory pathway TraG/TraD family ATPase VirD4